MANSVVPGRFREKKPNQKTNVLQISRKLCRSPVVPQTLSGSFSDLEQPSVTGWNAVLSSIS